MTTDTQDLIAWLRTDHAFDSTTKGNEAADKLEAQQMTIKHLSDAVAKATFEAKEALAKVEALQAENAQWRIDFKEMVLERNEALARLAELQKQVPIGHISPYEVNTILWNEGHEHVGCNSAVYAAAGASPVEPKHKSPLTDKELANPEYMRGYVEELNALIAELLASRAQPSQAGDALVAACKGLSDYIHAEQCATDGQVKYSTTTINHHVFQIRAAINAKGDV